MKNKYRVLIAAGGTGGHIIPAQQLAQKLLKKNACEGLLFAANDIKNNPYFQKEAFASLCISSSSIQKGWKFFFSIFALLKGIFQSWRCFSTFQPDVVVGFGSFHTFPILLVAYLRRKKIVLFEPNASFGKVNRLFAKKAHKIALQIPLDSLHMPNSVFVNFLPWTEKKKQEEQAKQDLKLQKGVWTFLVFGGSQGSKFINEQFLFAAEKLIEKKKQFQVIHLCGKNQDRKQLLKSYEKLKIDVYLKNYQKDMHPLFAAADMAICRSGASTIGELISYQLPAILIPYPFATNDHQQKNAQVFCKDVGGGHYFLEKTFSIDSFLSTIESMMENFCVSQKKNLQKYMQKKENTQRIDFGELIDKIMTRKAL